MPGVGRIDQDIRGESFHSPIEQYHKAKSSDVSESTEQSSDTVWTNAESIQSSCRANIELMIDGEWVHVSRC